jgi:putative membrane protein
MTLSDLPAVNACLNSASTLFLTLGYIFIRRQKQTAHRNCMVAALVSSTLFLACYLIYHYFAGRTTFQNPHWFRPIYLLLLLTHTVLTVVIVPMVILTVVHAFRQKWELHRKMARWTWPLWMYVSITGVMIYFLLYQIFPQR